jgi:hypothetical protein
MPGAAARRIDERCDGAGRRVEHQAHAVRAAITGGDETVRHRRGRGCHHAGHRKAGTTRGVEEHEARVRVRGRRLGEQHRAHVRVSARRQHDSAAIPIRVTCEPRGLLRLRAPLRRRHAVYDHAHRLAADVKFQALHPIDHRTETSTSDACPLLVTVPSLRTPYGCVRNADLQPNLGRPQLARGVHK